MSEPRENLDLAAVRARLDGARGRDYWRSLDDLASTPEFRDLVEREFPQQAIGWSDDEDPAQGRVTYTLTPRAFVAALVQYNSSSGLLGTNLRWRWEYIPGSELFVVYTDERDATVQGVPALNNRALVVKWAPLVRF